MRGSLGSPPTTAGVGRNNANPSSPATSPGLSADLPPRRLALGIPRVAKAIEDLADGLTEKEMMTRLCEELGVLDDVVAAAG